MSLTNDYNNYCASLMHECGPGEMRSSGGKGCRSGWLLSDFDTWHHCPYHFRGQPHPECEQEEIDAWYAEDEEMILNTLWHCEEEIISEETDYERSCRIYTEERTAELLYHLAFMTGDGE